MKTTFGGIGVAIVTHKTKFEIEIECLDDFLKGQAGRQLEIVSNASEELAKFYNTELEKSVSADALKKNLAKYRDLAACLQNEMKKLSDKLDEARQIAKRRNAAFSDFALFATDGRHRPLFVATKDDAQLSPFGPRTQPAVDPSVAVGDVQLARRFSEK